MAQYKLSDNRTVNIPDGDDDAYELMQQKLKEKNLTAELIVNEPGKSNNSTLDVGIEEARINALNQETNQSQNNQQQNKHFSECPRKCFH